MDYQFRREPLGLRPLLLAHSLVRSSITGRKLRVRAIRRYSRIDDFSSSIVLGRHVHLRPECASVNSFRDRGQSFVGITKFQTADSSTPQSIGVNNMHTKRYRTYVDPASRRSFNVPAASPDSRSGLHACGLCRPTTISGMIVGDRTRCGFGGSATSAPGQNSTFNVVCRRPDCTFNGDLTGLVIGALHARARLDSFTQRSVTQFSLLEH